MSDAIDIKPLLKQLWPLQDVPPPRPHDIAQAISLFFTNQVSEAQAASLLMALHFTALDRQPAVLAECARVMRQAAAKIPHRDDVADDSADGSSSSSTGGLAAVLRRRGRREGTYRGGLVDMVGTGGDAHDTFNISTTASILAASQVLIAKHGNRASTSKSGSADLVHHMKPRPPVLTAVTPQTLADVYAASNYGFLYAPVFHPGMRYVAPIRAQLPWRTIFNNLGPLSSPVETWLEARVIGVARRELGPAFAEALRQSGFRKALIVCGDEDLDEVSCAGPTHCWYVHLPTETTADRLADGEKPVSPDNIVVDYFTVEPADFGLPCHALTDVSSGHGPAENAAILEKILHGRLADDHPLTHFVLINTAALLAVSGVCEADASSLDEVFADGRAGAKESAFSDDGRVVTERGPGGFRWKEGVRRARWAMKSGAAWREWQQFVAVTNRVQM